MTEIILSIKESLLGFSKIIKHLDGSLLHLARQNGLITGPDEILVIKGKGMPLDNNSMNSNNLAKNNIQFGNLYIKVRVQFPKQLWIDKDKINKFEEFFPMDTRSRNPITVKNSDVNTEMMGTGQLDDFGELS